MGNFTGFGPATLDFLAELGDNNNRDWFQANKARYDEFVLEPALDFIGAVGDGLPTISKHLVAMPKRSGGSLMRVYRDTRFSRDKTPYKTNIGIQFRHEQGKDVHAPGLYFHLDNRECFLGVGMWHPERDALAAIRTAIVDNGATWKRARDAKAFRDVFELDGASLVRPPRGFPRDHRYITDLMRKDFIGILRMPPERAASPGLADEVLGMFAASKGFMRFLCRALGLPF
ncbi:MAG: DUF2461 domain-containing protein [Gammaproteobacteria bacterium]|nr:DUF2461 domain-containing protein [Gammaproteobacteria bacterium]